MVQHTQFQSDYESLARTCVLVRDNERQQKDANAEAARFVPHGQDDHSTWFTLGVYVSQTSLLFGKSANTFFFGRLTPNMYPLYSLHFD
jgi:hypothetical protein